ncbi:MAG: beta strand repeat-containing protein, partial [Pirellula sp.]
MKNLEGKSTGGGLFVVNTGPLIIGGVAATGPNGIEVAGNATIIARSPITIAENITAVGDLVFIAQENSGSNDNILLESGYSVQSQTGKVRFEAGDNITLLSGSSVTAFTMIEALGDYGNLDPQGTQIRLHGALIAPITIIRGNDQDDTIVIESTASTQGVTVAEGGLGSDTFTNNYADSSFTNPIVVFGDKLNVTYSTSTRSITSFATTASGTGSTDNLTNNGGLAVLVGGTAGDTLTGSSDADWFIGDEAQIDFTNNRILRISTSNSGVGSADSISAFDGNNFVLGGAGGDSITAGVGVNNILGDEGIFEVDSSGNLLLAQSSNASIGAADTFTLGSGTYRVIAGAGSETIQLGAGYNFVIGDAGVIQVNGDGTTTIASSNPTVSGSETITVQEGFNVIVGGSGSDNVSVVGGTGGQANATILGDNGTMTFSSQGNLTSISSLLGDSNGASDSISLTSGVSNVIGGAGADQITAGGGQNTVLGDDGEAFFFSDGTVRLIQSINLGSGANDQISLNDGTNTVIGGFGADRLILGGGTNYVMGDEAKLEVLTSGGVPTGNTVLES